VLSEAHGLLEHQPRARACNERADSRDCEQRQKVADQLGALRNENTTAKPIVRFKARKPELPRTARTGEPA
jgi:hypothetical protein